MLRAVPAGVLNHYWLGWLARRYADPTAASALWKMAWQHGVLNPFVYVPLFFGLTGAVRGRAAGEIAAQLRDEWGRTLVAVWSFWVPATGVMFVAVPERHQVLFVALTAFGWNVCLSLLTN